MKECGAFCSDEKTFMKKRLVINRENFCHYYIETGNASEAYRKAYPCSVSWKDGVVQKRAFELLKNPDVLCRMNELRDEACERFDMKKDDALRFLAEVVNVDPIDIMSTGKDSYIVKSIDEVPKSVRMCIQSIKNTQYGIEIRLYSKIAAITQISRMLGWDAPTKSDVSTNVRMIIGDDK